MNDYSGDPVLIHNVRPQDTMLGWLAKMNGTTVAEAAAGLRMARAMADSWACPECGEHGAHRCDR